MKPKHLFLLLTLVVLWGFNFVPTRVGLNHMPPLTFGAWRLLFTAFPAVFFIKKPDVPMKKLIAYGLLLFTGQFGFLYTAFHVGMPVGLGSLIMQTQVFVTMGLATFLLNEKPTIYQIVGALIASLGIVVVALHTGGDVSVMGLVLTLISATSWAFGNMVTKNMGRVNILAVVVWGNLFAFLPLMALALAIEGPDVVIHSVTDLQWLTVVSLAYVVIFSTHIGYTIWGHSLMRYPTALVAPFTLLVPPVALVFTSILLGEAFPPWKFGVSALILAGLCINQFGGKVKRWLIRNEGT